MRATSTEQGTFGRRWSVAAAAAAALLAAGLPAATPSPAVARTSVLVREVAPLSDAAERAVVALGGTVTRELPIVGGFVADLPTQAVGALQRLTGVVRDVVRPGKVGFEGSYGQGSGVASAVYPSVVRADRAWASGWTGSGVGIALIDTGVNASGDLAGKVVHSEDFSGEGDGVDRFGHGTFIAGLIAGTGAGSAGGVRGVAPDARIISLKIAGRDGSADITHVMAALQWAVSFKDTYNIRVVNLSLGTDSTQDYRIDPLNAAVERAWQAGLVVLVSASNKGPASGTIAKPADDPYVVTVGAIRDATTPGTGDDSVPSFSAAGPTASNGLAKPDIAAPGGSVVSTRVPGSFIDTNFPEGRVGATYFKGSGTSFSTGIASAAVALMLSRNPSLTPDQVKARLVDTARPGPVTDPMRVGAGWLDAYAATASDSARSANAGLTPSTGTGSLQASRGSVQVSVQAGTSSGLTGAVSQLVSGQLTAQLRPFDQVGYLTGEWSGSQWYGSQWYGSQWYGSQWYGSQWYGSQWYGSQWYGSQWYGSQWYGSQWE